MLVKIKVSKCIIVKKNVTGKITMRVLHLASGFVLKYICDWQAKYQLEANIAAACSNLWLKGFPQTALWCCEKKNCCSLWLAWPCLQMPIFDCKKQKEQGKPTSLKIGVRLCQFVDLSLWIQIKELLQEGNHDDVVGIWSNVSAASGDNSFNSLFQENMPQSVLWRDTTIMDYDDVLCSLFLSLVLVFAKFRFACSLENCTI